MIRKTFIVLFLFMLMPSQAAADTRTELLKALEEKASGMRTIACDFEQETHMSLFNEVITSQGCFLFQRPDMVRWEYTAPFKSGFIIQGATGREWDEASGEVRDFTPSQSPQMAQIAKHIIAWTTFDIQWLEELFDIQAESTPVPHLRLVPKDGRQNNGQHLDFFFSKDCSVLKTLEFHSADGDYTRIRFDNHRLNEELTDNAFLVK